MYKKVMPRDLNDRRISCEPSDAINGVIFGGIHEVDEDEGAEDVFLPEHIMTRSQRGLRMQRYFKDVLTKAIKNFSQQQNFLHGNKMHDSSVRKKRRHTYPCDEEKRVKGYDRKRSRSVLIKKIESEFESELCSQNGRPDHESAMFDSFDDEWKTDSENSVQTESSEKSSFVNDNVIILRKRQIKSRSWHVETRYSCYDTRASAIDIQRNRSRAPTLTNRNSLIIARANKRERSYSQRYDIHSSTVLSEICSPKLRSKTFDTLMENHDDFTTQSKSSVKKKPVRKVSIKTDPIRRTRSANFPARKNFTRRVSRLKSSPVCKKEYGSESESGGSLEDIFLVGSVVGDAKKFETFRKYSRVVPADEKLISNQSGDVIDQSNFEPVGCEDTISVGVTSVEETSSQEEASYKENQRHYLENLDDRGNQGSTVEDKTDEKQEHVHTPPKDCLVDFNQSFEMFFQLTNQTLEASGYRRPRSATVVGNHSVSYDHELEIDNYRANHRRARSFNVYDTEENKLRTFAVFSSNNNLSKGCNQKENFMKNVKETEKSFESKKSNSLPIKMSKEPNLPSFYISENSDEEEVQKPIERITVKKFSVEKNNVKHVLHNNIPFDEIKEANLNKSSIRRRSSIKTSRQKFSTKSYSMGEPLLQKQSVVHFARSASLIKSRRKSHESSPARRRRISVKSTHVRKQSTRPIAPRQRRRTLSSGCVQRSPQSPRRDQSASLPSPRFQIQNEGSSITSVVVPSRRLSVAVGRKPSNAFQKRPVRRCSEPFLLDAITLQNKCNRKHSAASRVHNKRRLSNASSLPTSSKQKLQALAKDELLASLNVPLTENDVCTTEHENTVVESADVTCPDEDHFEKNKEAEKERRETKRLLIMDEILETEKNYICCLETLNEVFRNQLEGTNIITEKDLNSLFPSHLNEIKTSHTWFMQELQERMNNADWRGIIGDIFAKMTSASANLLDIYTSYVNAFPKSISTLSKCTRSSQKFRKFLEDCYENPVVERLDLPSFLLSPVQRLPRYVLLLRELSKYTDEEHPDKYFISEAMKEMEDLISSLNSSIHSSMAFYSASDSRRKKMSRQLQSKKRKQRSSVITKSTKKLGSVNEGKPSDPDQGYCSFGEPKDESPEDDTSPRKGRSSTWRAGKRSMSMVSATSEDSRNGGVIMRKRYENNLSGRNTDTRKSWRRSLGAVFSQFWSKEEASSTNSSCKKTSKQHSHADDNTSNEEKSDQTKANDTPDHSRVPTRKTSNARRKLAIIQTPPPEEVKNDVNDNVQELNDLIRDSSIDDDRMIVSSPVSVDIPSITSSIASEEEIERCPSTESESSAASLKTPNSPQHFKRGKLRGSAGPVFKSIFNKNSQLQKTLSWDELNTLNTSQDEKRQKRFSFRKSRNNSKDQILTSSDQIDSSISSRSLNKDNISISSTETISSKNSSNMKEDEVFAESNNGSFKQPSKEKKSKVMKTLKRFVSKSK
ncbi:uncharacterized protein LOC130657988 isoform X1 [Hydractinia symbiolongicarpus]|uniref:uncharacterized protein LOC130657988 isoform X1 n=1 Tax=Hydractinia symbiolongicarpus TaxID=13093 RepID=UPI00254AA7C6|nr:uncharacterized protein LOC130657988 isoform X1 [Hydractinia symbiolongicarpus]